MEKLYHYYYYGYHGNNLTSLFHTKAISFFNVFKHRVCTVSFKYQVFQKFANKELNKRNAAHGRSNYRALPPHDAEERSGAKPKTFN
jgi:hypothetical protein